MRILKFLPIVFVGAFLCVIQCSAADIYIAQTAQGADSGADAANAHSVAWFNTPANWGGGANQIGLGCTVHLCGIVSNPITFQTDGSAGNPITLLFELNAKMSMPTWTGYIITARSGCVIDGGQNGIIEATATGTGLAFSNNICAVYIPGCNDVTVKNLLVQNLYVHSSWADESGGGSAVFAINGVSNITVTNCTFHDMQTGFFLVYGPGCFNILYSHCTAYNCNWGGAAGDSGSSSTLNGLTVDHCHFYNWKNWDESDNKFHHNGFYAWAESSGMASNVTFSANYVGPGYGYHNTSGMFISGHNLNNFKAYNNIFDASDGTAPANAQLSVGNYSPSTTNMVFNNTFTGPNATALRLFGLGNGQPVCTNYVFNNEFYNCGYAIAFYWGATIFPALQTDRNNFYGNPLFVPSYDGNGGDNTHLVDWQVYGNQYSLYLDPHSTTSNPLLDGKYRPQAGSPLIGAGINLSSYFTTDYNGNTRPATGPWTIGAYEGGGKPSGAAAPPPMAPPQNLKALASNQ